MILHAYKGISQGSVTITSSAGASDPVTTMREAPSKEVVDADDPERFIHLNTDGIGADVTRRMRRLGSSLGDLGLSVSTGRVVQFRAREHLRDEPAAGTAPLIFPSHFSGQGRVEWPSSKRRKPNAIAVNGHTIDLLLRNGTYVLVKRFSAKEERRRIVATISDPEAVAGEFIAFENHLNVFHHDGGPLIRTLQTERPRFLTPLLLTCSSDNGLDTLKSTPRTCDASLTPLQVSSVAWAKQ